MSDSQITMEELLFFDKKPQIIPIYETFRNQLVTNYDVVQIKVDKTQISFKNRYIFACASMQRVSGGPKDYLLITFGLDYEKKSPRISVATEAASNRWTHHVIVRQPQEIDGELMSWINEAYQFAGRKNRTKGKQ